MDRNRRSPFPGRASRPPHVRSEISRNLGRECLALGRGRVPRVIRGLDWMVNKNEKESERCFPVPLSSPDLLSSPPSLTPRRIDRRQRAFGRRRRRVMTRLLLLRRPTGDSE